MFLNEAVQMSVLAEEILFVHELFSVARKEDANVLTEDECWVVGVLKEAADNMANGKSREHCLSEDTKGQVERRIEGWLETTKEEIESAKTETQQKTKAAKTWGWMSLGLVLLGLALAFSGTVALAVIGGLMYIAGFIAAIISLYSADKAKEVGSKLTGYITKLKTLKERAKRDRNDAVEDKIDSLIAKLEETREQAGHLQQSVA